MKKLSYILTNILKIFIALDLAALCIVLFLNIVSRLVYHSLVWSVELANFLFVYLIFFGAIVALAENKHFKVEMLLDVLPSSLRKIFMLVSNIIILFILFIFSINSIDLVADNMGSTTSILRIPYAVYYIIGIIAGIPMFMIVLIKTINIFRGANLEDQVNQD